MAATPPQYLTLKEHRDAEHLPERIASRAVIGLLAAVSAAGLANVFGQRPVTTGAGELEVTAPTRLRGGLFFEGRFAIEAQRSIDDAVLVLDHGWLEQITVNTVEPTPVKEGGSDGRLALGFGPVDAGERLVVYVQFQVNPTNVGRRSQRVELRDGADLVATANRTVTVFP